MFELGFILSNEPLGDGRPVFEYALDGRRLFLMTSCERGFKDPPGYLEVYLNPVSTISGISEPYKGSLDSSMAAIFVAYTNFVNVEMNPNNNRFRDDREFCGSNFEDYPSGEQDRNPSARLSSVIYKIEFLKTLFVTADGASMFVYKGMLDGLQEFQGRSVKPQRASLR